MWLISACTETVNQSAKAPVEEPALSVETMKLAEQTYVEFGEYYGQAKAREQIELLSYAGGRVKELKVRPGDVIKKGQQLCDIDADRVSTEFEKSQLREKIAKDKYKRFQIHLKRGSSSRLAAEEAQLAWLDAKAARITAEKHYKGALCMSPINGRVLSKHIDLYQEIAPNTPTLTIAKTESLLIKIGVPETEVSQFKKGSPGVIFFGTNNRYRAEGIVDNVSEQLDMKSRNFTVELLVDNKGHKIKPGQLVKTKLLKYKVEKQIVIPSDAILNISGNRVVMINDKNIARLRKVQVGSSNGKESWVLGGLYPGDDLIIAGQYQVGEGSKIKFDAKSSQKQDSKTKPKKSP